MTLKLIIALVCLFIFSSNASSVSSDKIIISDVLLNFGSNLLEMRYQPLKGSTYYKSFIDQESVKNQKSLSVNPTGCLEKYNALWKIEGDRLFLMDIQPCWANFTDWRKLTNRIEATWVSNIFIVEDLEKSDSIVCRGKGLIYIENQKFYIIEINNGRLISIKVVAISARLNFDFFGGSSADFYLANEKTSEIIKKCREQ